MKRKNIPTSLKKVLQRVVPKSVQSMIKQGMPGLQAQRAVDPRKRVYQTHEGGEKGMSDTMRKMNRLHFPTDLRGMKVLDIGCNEGWFCGKAMELGAQAVIGIDFDKGRLDFAIDKYASTGAEFRHQKWDALPQGPFDLILWLSAMHYEKNPRSIIDNIMDVLAPGGLFILECGVMAGISKEMVQVLRHSDVQYYPTLPFLKEELLQGFSVRHVAPGEVTEGDPVPRHVFHCRKWLPVVLLVTGESGMGKTALTDVVLSKGATKTVSLDMVVTRIAMSKFAHNDLHKVVQSQYERSDLSRVYKSIESNGLTRDFAKVLVDGITSHDTSVVIEGLMGNELKKELKDLLVKRAHVWEVSRA